MIAIVVTSCEKYYKHTLPMLLTSLKSAGIRAENVFVVVGQSSYECDSSFGMDDDYIVRSYHRTYANMDNNGMLWVVSDKGREALQEYKWMFYMHDTCVVDQNFNQSLHETFQLYYTSSTKAMRLYHQFSMSMGYYSLDAVWSPSVVEYLTRATNYNTSDSAMQDVKYTCEDKVFVEISQAFPDSVVCLPNNYIVRNLSCEIYGTSVPRIVESWQYPKFDKYKANWGQSQVLHFHL